jgi:hypothetical protein
MDKLKEFFDACDETGMLRGAGSEVVKDKITEHDILALQFVLNAAIRHSKYPATEQVFLNAQRAIDKLKKLV